MKQVINTLRRRWAALRYELGWGNPRWEKNHLDQRDRSDHMRTFIRKFDTVYVGDLVQLSRKDGCTEPDIKRIIEIGIALYLAGGVMMMWGVLDTASRWFTPDDGFKQMVISAWTGIGPFPFANLHDYLDSPDPANISSCPIIK